MIKYKLICKNCNLSFTLIVFVFSSNLIKPSDQTTELNIPAPSVLYLLTYNSLLLNEQYELSKFTFLSLIDLISDPLNTSPAMYFLFKKYLNFAFLFTMLMFCCT